MKAIMRLLKVSAQSFHRRATHSICNSLSFEDIPCPNGIAIIQLLKNGGPSYLHRHVDIQHKKLGPIFRQKLGPVELVFIADADLIQLVCLNEGEYPHHNVPPAWQFYNDLKKINRGLFFMFGPKWSETRKFMNKVFLEPRNFERRLSTRLCMFNDAISELFTKWSSNLREEEKAISLTDLKDDLCHWSIETVGIMLFDRRLDCLNDDNIQAKEFVKHVMEIFVTTARMQLIPAKLAWALNLNVWKEFDHHMTKALELAHFYVDNSTRNVTNDSSNSNNNKIISYEATGDHLDSTSIVEDMILHMENREEVVQTVVDLIIAAADTSANAIQWALYLLSKNPAIQEKIFQETVQITGGRLPNMEDINKMSFAEACVKESLRLYPVAPFIARTLDSSIKLHEYELPAGKTVVFSLLTTSRDEKYFEKAEEFHPARWLSSLKSTTTNSEGLSCPGRRKKAYASLPFGARRRSCIGRRMAELQMRLMLSRIVTEFKIELVSHGDIEIKLCMVTTPERRIDLRLIPRDAIQNLS